MSEFINDGWSSRGMPYLDQNKERLRVYGLGISTDRLGIFKQKISSYKSLRFDYNPKSLIDRVIFSFTLPDYKEACDFWNWYTDFGYCCQYKPDWIVGKKLRDGYFLS